MKLFQTLLSKLRSGTATDGEIEDLDRRGFMFGMAATAAGLVVARPILFGAAELPPFGSFHGARFYVARGIFIDNFDTMDVQSYQLINAVGESEFVANPDETLRRAMRRPVTLTDDHGVDVAIVSVPRDSRPS